jgi:phage major head subunit gpT-like protein
MLSAEALALIKSTGSAKFESDLQQVTPRAYELFTTPDTYGSEGYVPFLMGGLGQSEEWVNARTLHEIKEYGVSYHGKRYSNGVKHLKTYLADSPVVKASKIAAALAADAIAEPQKRVLEALKGNSTGFDNVSLFGDHIYSAAGAVYSNDINGSGSPVYLLNKFSMLDLTRTDEDFQMQIHGGDNTSIDFLEDSIAFAWRKRGMYRPGFWGNSVRSHEALTADSLRRMMHLQANFKNDKGARISKKSNILVVGQSNQAAAEKLLKAALIDGGNSNMDLGRCTLVVLDELDD